MGLERDTIVRTAVRLLDEVGLDKLTLRRLAAELGVQAPALYWHFRNKQELLDEMAEVLTVREGQALRPLAVGESWEEWLAGWFRDQRRVFNAHRDTARLAAGTHPGQGTLATVELILESLQRAGFTPMEAMGGVGALASFTGGFVLEEQADRERQMNDQSQLDQAFEELTPYPRLRAVLTEMGGPQSDASFEHGLSLIIAGMRARLAEKSGSQGGDGDLAMEGVRPEGG
ncbi:TetR/AcrR family transcriptional regulator C-terminal domain-containing protein [Microbispora sp. NPDC049125]|uniref:TetR/AcrR family transcriptional regulator C-terminal domain-containing protein n=1 Tax=Microbispora sp. NPDC049125 TaxID=3154929 RepID=UPI003465CDDC